MASSVASTASPAPSPSEGKVLKGRDLINIGIFTAIYFVIQFVFMLCGGIHPALWVFMPALDGLFAGIPFMLMCAKVQKPGAVVIMGLIVALIYFATGMFTPLILAMMAASCVVAEVIRAVARYRSFLGNAVAYAVFGLGMCGSPLPLWVFHDSFPRWPAFRARCNCRRMPRRVLRPPCAEKGRHAISRSRRGQNAPIWCRKTAGRMK